MVSARKYLGGETLRKEDVPNPVGATIRGVGEIQYEGERAKLTLQFKEFDKSLVVNDTNLNILCDIFGTDDTDVWTGKQIELYTDENVMFQGRRIGGLRVREYVDAPF